METALIPLSLLFMICTLVLLMRKDKNIHISVRIVKGSGARERVALVRILCN